ncbi:hypothetical protein DPN68_11045 [Flavobacterium tibetense]|uniref:Uncharacterized protein n=1 Tax=Flavobacterium tibetense TaxID=2233533 RepID=A0A365NZB5_9FLAO|nr:hypothetical protein DPN68_11045 [Flavobacterium tibetense]
MDTHPYCYASYVLSVRQYRLLPFDFLQCIPRGKPPCHVLNLRDVTLAVKGLTPSGKITPRKLVFVVKICIFELFEKLSGCVLHMQGTHSGFKKLGFSGLI